MPRRSGGGGGRAGGARPARTPVRSPPQPAPASHAPSPAPVQSSGGGMLSGIGSTIAQGLAFGTGSSIAHRAVDGIMGPRTVQHEYAPAEGASAAPGAPAVANMSGPDSCGNQAKAFQDCLNNYGSDISKCQFYVDMLNECRRGPVSAQF